MILCKFLWSVRRNEVQLISEILPRLPFGFFHREGCGLSSFSIPRMHSRCTFILKPCLVGSFPSLNSIFNLLVLPLDYLLPLLATPSFFRPHTRAADESRAASNSCHSSSASVVHSGSSRKDKLSTKVFLSSLSSRVSRRGVQSSSAARGNCLKVCPLHDYNFVLMNVRNAVIWKT